jgi:hypothetical protein
VAGQLSNLLTTYRPAMAAVFVETSHGTATGSAFHLGDGYYATASHVVLGDDLVVDGFRPEGLHAEFDAQLVCTDEANDVAIARIDYVADKTIPIGSHLDDWIRDEDFYLSEVLILGYPPIPRSDDVVLVAVSGEVNAVIDRYDRNDATPDFVLSPLPRGGFSGGPAISSHDFVLGVISHELVALSRDDPRHDVRDDSPVPYARPGFTAAVSVEPLINLMMAYGLRPSGQTALLDELGG